MKLWIDDQLNEKDMPARWTPPGWTGVKTTLGACRLIKTGKVTAVNFDHDLGEGNGSGYIIARYIEKLAYERKIGRIEWFVHSGNPTGASNIERAMKSAEKFWSK